MLLEELLASQNGLHSMEIVM